jgi:hypothetical protein
VPDPSFPSRSPQGPGGVPAFWQGPRNPTQPHQVSMGATAGQRPHSGVLSPLGGWCCTYWLARACCRPWLHTHLLLSPQTLCPIQGPEVRASQRPTCQPRLQKLTTDIIPLLKILEAHSPLCVNGGWAGSGWCEIGLRGAFSLGKTSF